MRVTGVTVEQLTDPALCSHFEMVRAIRGKLNAWSPAIFVGHNSLGFDEHLLRQAFYKTLHPPYLTNTNGNRRTDSLRMVQAVALCKPNALAIPIDQRARQSFKLDQLAPANGFPHGDAHEAMGDVEATIYMCRLIAERTPLLWENFTRFSQKVAVMDYVMGEEVFALTDFYYARPYSWLVTAVGLNPQNGAEVLVFDLSSDPQDLMRLADDELAFRLTVRPRVVRGLRTSAAPIIHSYGEAPNHLRDAAPDLAALRRRASVIKADTGFRERLTAAYLAGREEREPSMHVEEQIYDRFIDGSNQAILDRFHAVDWLERLSVLGDLADERLRALGHRLIYCEASHVIPDAVRHDCEVAIARRLMASEGAVPWVTLSKAITEATDLLANTKGDEAALLNGHLDRLRRQATHASALLA
jgi:exodeoxyribonuclease-1